MENNLETSEFSPGSPRHRGTVGCLRLQGRTPVSSDVICKDQTDGRLASASGCHIVTDRFMLLAGLWLWCARLSRLPQLWLPSSSWRILWTRVILFCVWFHLHTHPFLRTKHHIASNKATFQTSSLDHTSQSLNLLSTQTLGISICLIITQSWNVSNSSTSFPTNVYLSSIFILVQGKCLPPDAQTKDSSATSTSI